MPHNLTNAIKSCCTCQLYRTRTQAVVGRENPHATFWFIGEAPGADEDKQGEAFVGRAGRMLDQCLTRAGILPRVIYITNIVKCRPPENRNPTEEEFKTCSEAWLYAQLASARPKVIVAMGRFAIGFFRHYPWDHIEKMGVTKEVKKGRFVWQQPAHKDHVRLSAKRRVFVYPAFHPAYIMRTGDTHVRGFIKTLMQAKKLHDSLG
jgi:uracil-DNA glycosylase family 4